MTAPMSTSAAITSPIGVPRRARPPAGRRRYRRPARRRDPSPARAATHARQRMPLPLISAAPPSAFSRVIVQSAPLAPAPIVMSPSAPMPRCRSHSAATLAAASSASPASSASRTRKSLPVACSLASCSRSWRARSAGAGGVVHRAITAREVAPDFGAASIQWIRGSRRNHIRWRRAN